MKLPDLVIEENALALESYFDRFLGIWIPYFSVMDEFSRFDTKITSAFPDFGTHKSEP